MTIMPHAQKSREKKRLPLNQQVKKTRKIMAYDRTDRKIDAWKNAKMLNQTTRKIKWKKVNLPKKMYSYRL